MLKVVQENNESNRVERSEAGVSLLDEIVRDGARQMLTAALAADVADVGDGPRDDRDHSVTHEGIAINPSPRTIVCTIVIDP